MYELMINGGWIELSKETVRYFDGSQMRRRFRPAVAIRRFFRRIKFNIKNL
jgi:hypothetical protein